MKSNRFLVFLSLLLLSGLLTACSGRTSTNWPGIASDGKYAYLSNGSSVYIVQLSNGKETTVNTPDGKTQPLRFPLQSDNNLLFYAAPAITSDGQLVVGSANQSNESLFSFDPKTANINWTFSGAKGVWLATPLIVKDTIYASGGDGNVYALDSKGNEKWSTSVSAHGVWTSPTTDGTSIFVTSLDHEVAALDAQSGKQQWKATLDNSILGSPAVGSDGNIYIGTLSGSLYALKASDGSQLWKQNLNGGIWSTPVIDGDMLYVGTVNGKVGTLYALHTTDGTTAWSTDENSSIIASPLIVGDQIIYVTDGGIVQSLKKADGSANWQKTIDKAQIYTTPILADKLILVAPMQTSEQLYAFDQNGNQKWTFVPQK